VLDDDHRVALVYEATEHFQELGDVREEGPWSARRGFRGSEK
jgi:hypothetical protein